MQCRNQRCRFQTSLRAGTIMAGSRLPLRHWFAIAFLFLDEGLSGLGVSDLHRRLGVRRASVGKVIARLREGICHHSPMERPLLRGNVMVDIAEGIGVAEPLQGEGVADLGNRMICAVRARGPVPGEVRLGLLGPDTDIVSFMLRTVDSGNTIQTRSQIVEDMIANQTGAGRLMFPVLRIRPGAAHGRALDRVFADLRGWLDWRMGQPSHDDPRSVLDEFEILWNFRYNPIGAFNEVMRIGPQYRSQG